MKKHAIGLGIFLAAADEKLMYINVNNFVQKDLDEMFPKWDGDVDDPAADNIIKVMFDDPGWKWTMDCWQVTGTQKPLKIEARPVKNEASPVSPVTNEASPAKKESVVKEESSRPRKKARQGSYVEAEALVEGSQAPSTTIGGMAKEQFQMVLKDISDAMRDGFGTCLREIKLVGDRMGAVEKKMGALEKMVGITKKRSSSNDLQLTNPETTSTNPAKPVHKPGVKLAIVKIAEDLPSCEPIVLILEKQVSTAEYLLQEEARRQTKKEAYKVNLRGKSERDRKLAPTQQTPFKGNNTAKQIIPNKKVGKGYDPFAPYDKKKSEELTERVKTDPAYKLPLKKTTKMSKSVSSDPPNQLRMVKRPCESSPPIFLLISRLL
ncbi:hypothetical protein Bca4012_024999 [Brassica carinata]